MKESVASQPRPKRKRNPLLMAARLAIGTVKVFLWTLWSAYQLALGAILVLIAVALWQVDAYFSVREILSLRNENPPTTAFIEAEKSRLAGEGARNPRIHWEWVPLAKIPREVRELALVAEDSKFYSHNGFDWEQIEYAIVANHQAGRKARGASTISQQVAKNLYLSGDKAYVRKLREAVMTVLLEQTLSKDRILEIYLNTAQFGPGVFGVKQGATKRFGKPLQSLSQDEKVSLVALLPSPLRWGPERPSRAYARHKQRVARNYGLYRGFSPKEGEQADGEALDRLAGELEEERWKDLRTSAVVEGAEAESLETDSGSAAAPAAAPAAPQNAGAESVPGDPWEGIAPSSEEPAPGEALETPDAPAAPDGSTGAESLGPATSLSVDEQALVP